MKIEFDYKLFETWFRLNNMSRNKVIKVLGQQDPNKAGRWLTGQVIATEDLIALCNHFNLELGDFFIITDEEISPRINTALPDVIKERREKRSNALEASLRSKAPTSEVITPDELAITQLALKYEQKINSLISSHSQEMKDFNANTRNQVERRNELVKSLQNTIDTLSQTILQHTKEVESLTDIISTLKETIEQQQETISTYEAIIRKQKKIPSQRDPLSFGQVAMVQDGGGVISTAPTSNNGNKATDNSI